MKIIWESFYFRSQRLFTFRKWGRTKANEPGQVLSFHPRKQHNFEQAAVLADLYPTRFTHITSIYFGPATVKLLRRIAPGFAAQIGKRSYSKLPKKYVITLPSTEMKKYFLKKKQGDTHLADYMNLNEYWQKKAISYFNPPQICISADGISDLLFKEWKNKSKLVLDLSCGLPQYRFKVIRGESFRMEMLDEADEVEKRLFALHKEEVELADIILCGSTFVKNTVVYFFPELENKCRVLPYGMNLEDFGYPERQFEQRLDLKFAFVGRISLRKGADLMLDAWRDFVASHPMSELHFFGTADKEFNLDQLPEKVFVHGWLMAPELIGKLKTMDVFVFPTTFEGSSIAVFQAMALKLPVITTLNSGTVLKHGESCEIIEVGDREGLVNAMNKLFQSLEYRKRLAENAYLLCGQYTWEDYKIRLGKILEEVN